MTNVKIPSFYYNDYYKEVADAIVNAINGSSTNIMTGHTIESTRAVGDAIETFVSDNFGQFLGNWCDQYSSDFSRRAMEDIAFTDKEGFYSIVDVKTHREDTKFNMPNLTSVDRLSRFYESDSNVFTVMIIKYNVTGDNIDVTSVLFAPIEFLSWNCLTVGALGWGQIQIANSNNIEIVDKQSRKTWMLEFCNALLDFYPKEIQKIENRKQRFESVRSWWENREDIWARGQY